MVILRDVLTMMLNRGSVFYPRYKWFQRNLSPTSNCTACNYTQWSALNYIPAKFMRTSERPRPPKLTNPIHALVCCNPVSSHCEGYFYCEQMSRMNPSSSRTRHLRQVLTGHRSRPSRPSFARPPFLHRAHHLLDPPLQNFNSTRDFIPPENIAVQII